MEPDFDPVAASGESTYRAPRALELNELLINGDADVTETESGKFERKGGYLRKRILVGKQRDQKPEEENLGESVSVIFLKIRRKLVQRGDRGKVLFSTNEHNAATDVVDLYGENGYLRSGSAKSLREAYPGLRTVQIVYALLVSGAQEPELVRITIKGASLGSENKDDATTDFYKYLSSFGREEHVWEFVTNIRAVLEKGQKSYFCMHFERGQKLDDDFLKLALERMKEVHLRCQEIDQARAEKRKAAERAVYPEDNPDQPVHDPAIDEGDRPAQTRADDINPDDIPF